MKQYHDLLKTVLEKGTQKTDRTGTGTISIFGHQMRFDLSEGFPLVTTKKVHLKSIIYELLWMLKGDTNIKYLNENGVHIWDKWARENGDLGRVYGAQWVSWRTSDGKEINQIAEVIEQIKTNPDSRRLVVSAWNVGELKQMALMPCHNFFDFNVSNGKLSCHLHMRSNDIFLGNPFNIAGYALLTMMVAQVCELGVGELVFSISDAHIYNNHLEQVKLQLSRDFRPLPTMVINPKIKHIDDFTYDDFKLEGYNPHPTIKGDVAV